jgi:hypothetical protein
VSDGTLGWTLIVSFKQSLCGRTNLNRVLIHVLDQISNFVIVLLVLSLELFRRLLSLYRGVRSGISYIKKTEVVCPLTGIKSYEGEYRKSAEDEKAVAVTVKAYPMNKYPDSRLVHTKVQDLGDTPHIGKIYGTELEGGVLFVATMLPLSTLELHIQNFHTCPTTGQEFCSSLIESLTMLHGINIANLNIRPEHIVLEGCNVRIVDFSHAKAFESDAASLAEIIVDKHMLACTILYTLSGGLDANGEPLDFDELMETTSNGFDDDALFASVKAGQHELADLLCAMVADGSRLDTLGERPYFWGREQTVAYLGEEVGNLLDPGATKTSPHYPFIEALEARGDAELSGSYSEELKQDGPSWAAQLDTDYPLTQGSPDDPTGWGKSRSAQQAPADVEHTYAVYGKNPSAKQKTAREGHLKSGKKNMEMANRRMVGLLKTIRNVAFAHRSQHVQFGRFDTEEDVMRYMIDPFPWLLMAVYKLDREYQIAGSVATTTSGKGLTTGSEATTDDEAKAGYLTDGAAKPKAQKPAMSGDEAAKGKKKAKPPKASAVIKNAKDAKTIQQLEETVNRVKHDASIKDYKISALEEELAAFCAQTNPAPEPKPKPVPEPEPQREPAHHPKKAGEAEPEPEPASKPEPTLEPDPESAPTLPSLPSRADGVQEPGSTTTSPTQP